MSVFTLVVEEESRLELTVEFEPGPIPDIITLPNGTKLVCVGKYAEPGERFRFRRALEHKVGVQASDSPVIAVTLEGGLVTSVITSDPTLIGVDVAVIDYDASYSMGDEEVTVVPQGPEGDDQIAFVHRETIHRAEIPLETYDEWKETTLDEYYAQDEEIAS